MKLTLVPVVVLISSAAMLAAGKVKYLKPLEAKVRPTHESLSRRQKEAGKETANDSLVPVEPGTLKRSKPAGERKGIVERSSILCSGYHWTLVPKGAVIHVPAAYASRVNGERKGRLLPWNKFLQKNRTWLQVHSVSIKQARGERELKPEEVELYKRTGRVVVAVCHKGPISVIPYAPPEEGNADGSTREIPAARVPFTNSGRKASATGGAAPR